MSTTPEVVAKKRGRPKKVVAAPEIAPATQTTKSTAAAIRSTSKKSISTTTTRTPRKSLPKASSTAASELKTPTVTPIDQKSASKKGSPTRQKKSSTILLICPSTKSISKSESAELPGKLKTIENRQAEEPDCTVQAAVEISDSVAKSAGGGGTIELETTPQNSVAAAAVQGSKILNALAASNQSAGSTTSVEDKIKKSSGSIKRSPVVATAEMPTPARQKISPSSSRPAPSQPPPIKPPRKQAAPREAPLLRPQRPEQAPSVKPQDVRNTKQYKSLARRWTSAMVALPILLYTSYALYERVFADKAPRSLPGTNNFPPVNDSSHPSPSSTIPSSPPSSGSTIMANKNKNNSTD
ncbi:hypothetical protein ACJ72_03520 [Emergomyces africanus]|uniref:Uncharacterized protein n=1 Tax=Emergomyces africanus TaxID=1955775 RepID=A0A1B7NZB5_9EURO|nr:hypothetical protein ACJ72_03520 [Emergomyces africanus]